MKCKALQLNGKNDLCENGVWVLADTAVVLVNRETAVNKPST